jgi:hypothetical protein
MCEKFFRFLCCLIGFSAFAFRVPSAQAAAHAPDFMMKAGAAKVAITPGAASLKELTTVMGTRATQIDHDIYARALVLNDGTSRLAIVTYDLNCLDVATPILRVRCRDESHPLQSSQTHIDTGHPGYAVEFVEAAFPGSVGLYADACGGNQFPDRGVIMYAPADQVKALGKQLGESAVAIAKRETLDVTGRISSTLEILSLPLAAPMSYEKAKALAKERKVPLGIGFVPYPHPDRGTNWIRALLKHHEQKIPFPTRTTDRVCTDDEFLVEKLDDHREFPSKFEEVIVTTIGPLCFVALQGEVCAPIGMRIKDAFRRQMPLFLGSYMGEHNLYIPTRELVRLDAYQAQVIRIQYASPVGWAPEVEDEMVDRVCKVVTKMTGKRPERVIR